MIEPKPGAPVGIEIKYSSAPKPSRGFYEALDDIEAKHGYVLHPGRDSWPVSDRVTALGLSDFRRVWEPR